MLRARLAIRICSIMRWRSGLACAWSCTLASLLISRDDDSASPVRSGDGPSKRSMLNGDHRQIGATANSCPPDKMKGVTKRNTYPARPTARSAFVQSQITPSTGRCGTRNAYRPSGATSNSLLCPKHLFRRARQITRISCGEPNKPRSYFGVINLHVSISQEFSHNILIIVQSHCTFRYPPV